MVKRQTDKQVIHWRVRGFLSGRKRIPHFSSHPGFPLLLFWTHPVSWWISQTSLITWPDCRETHKLTNDQSIRRRISTCQLGHRRRVLPHSPVLLVPSSPGRLPSSSSCGFALSIPCVKQVRIFFFKKGCIKVKEVRLSQTSWLREEGDPQLGCVWIWGQSTMSRGRLRSSDPDAETPLVPLTRPPCDHTPTDPPVSKQAGLRRSRVTCRCRSWYI